jgi:hypothetical protein
MKMDRLVSYMVWLKCIPSSRTLMTAGIQGLFSVLLRWPLLALQYTTHSFTQKLNTFKIKW